MLVTSIRLLVILENFLPLVAYSSTLCQSCTDFFMQEKTDKK